MYLHKALDFRGLAKNLANKKPRDFDIDFDLVRSRATGIRKYRQLMCGAVDIFSEIHDRHFFFSLRHGAKDCTDFKTLSVELKGGGGGAHFNDPLVGKLLGRCKHGSGRGWVTFLSADPEFSKSESIAKRYKLE